jgi:phospholipase A1
MIDVCIKNWKHYVRYTGMIFGISFALLQNVQAIELQDCMAESLKTATDSMTIGELRLQCEKQIHDDTDIEKAKDEPAREVVQERVQYDKKHVLQPFTLMAHKPNYALGASYNSTPYNTEFLEEQFNDSNISLDAVEAKFQISLKFPLLVGLFNDTFDIYAAYTNRSFWQVYNKDASSPFRETNHEPEAWVQFHPNWEFLGFTNAWNSFGIVHQSNGRGGTLSRSWNRVYAWFTLERGNLAMSFKPWYRIPEDSVDDDNADITDYLGHYELTASYKVGENVFSMMSRNNIESGFKRGAFEFSWSFPLGNWPYLKGYAQYFTGYGESLIDYNQYVNTIGIGVSLTDWL